MHRTSSRPLSTGLQLLSALAVLLFIAGCSDNDSGSGIQQSPYQYASLCKEAVEDSDMASREIPGDGLCIDPLDIDGDEIPINLDPDIDGDGIPNDRDPDIDGDGINNEQDRDDDGDRKPDIIDPLPIGPIPGPIGKCPPNATGEYPDCKCPSGTAYNPVGNFCFEPILPEGPVRPPQTCPDGSIGQYPNCQCDAGEQFNPATNRCDLETTNCSDLPGAIGGTWPNCVCEDPEAVFDGSACLGPDPGDGGPDGLAKQCEDFSGTWAKYKASDKVTYYGTWQASGTYNNCQCEATCFGLQPPPFPTAQPPEQSCGNWTPHLHWNKFTNQCQ
jgi:hypothetical protein